MFVHVCRNCGAVHTEDWFAYKWVKKFQRKTKIYVLEKREKREEKVDVVDCRVCDQPLHRHNVPKAIEGTYEIYDTRSNAISEDEYGELYFLGHNVDEPMLPLYAIPIPKETAEEIRKKIYEGWWVLKIIAGKDRMLVFGISKERPSYELMEKIMREIRKEEEEDKKTKQVEKTGILSFT